MCGILELYYSPRGINGGKNEVYYSEPGGRKMVHFSEKSADFMFRG